MKSSYQKSQSNVVDFVGIDSKFDDVFNFLKTQRDQLDPDIPGQEDEIIALNNLSHALGSAYDMFQSYVENKKTSYYENIEKRYVGE